jgi:Spy/CpxP family protein refolding chaperone
MKNLDIKVKTALILVITLLIGIVFGAMLHRAIFQSRVKGFLAMQTPDGFARRFGRAIDTTPEQEEKVKKILDKYAGQFFEMNQSHMKEVSALFKSFHEELSRVLTPEQMGKIRDRRLFRPGRFPRDPGSPGWRPPFPGPEKRRPFRGFEEQGERRDAQSPPKEKKSEIDQKNNDKNRI